MYRSAFVDRGFSRYTCAMSDELTQKQEAACQAYIECGGNQSEAYRQAYNAENMAAKTIWETASTLFALPKVAKRVLELQEEHKDRHNVTVDSLVKELDEARDLAKKIKQPSAMTGAVMGKAKITGHVTDKQSVDHTSSDGSMSLCTLDTSKLSTTTLKELLAARDESSQD